MTQYRTVPQADDYTFTSHFYHELFHLYPIIRGGLVAARDNEIFLSWFHMQKSPICPSPVKPLFSCEGFPWRLKSILIPQKEKPFGSAQLSFAERW